MQFKCLFQFSLLILFVFSSCSLDSSNHVIEDINGVKYIRNYDSLWDENPGVRLEFVRKIGVMDGTDPNYLLHIPVDVVVDSDNNTYIADAGNHRVQKFSSDGEYLATIGRQGQGPGEFSGDLRCMDIHNDTLFVVYSNVVVQKFLIDGTPLDRVRGINDMTHLRHFSTGGLIHDRIIELSGRQIGNWNYASQNNELVIVFSEKDGTIINRIAPPVMFDDPIETQKANYISYDIDKDDNIYISFDNLNRIDKYSAEGKHISSFDRPLKFETTDKPEWMDTGRGLSPHFIPVSTSTGIDSENRVWVVTLNIDILNNRQQAIEKEGNIFDFHIFSSEGLFLGSIPVPVSFKSFKIRIFGSRLFIIENVNEMCIQEYRIIEN
ncbi:hypothetical protein ACFL7D_07315 [candidate division KSB1 bacterium]